MVILFEGESTIKAVRFVKQNKIKSVIFTKLTLSSKTHFQMLYCQDAA